ncbi:MAG: hypothetical protein JSV32_06630, partial [Dehalococcoidia bacterium]
MQNGNWGIVKIDSTGTVFPVAVPAPAPIPGIGNFQWRFPAGDVTPDGSKMYINAQVTSNASVANQTLYIYNIAAGTVDTKTKTFPGFTTVNVADWAVNPIDGNLYGASYTGQIFQMDPNGTNAVITKVGDTPLLPSGSPGQPLDAYGGAWFNADGHFFAYRNVGEIYEIDLDLPLPATPTIVSTQSGGPSSDYNDAAACAF